MCGYDQRLSVIENDPVRGSYEDPADPLRGSGKNAYEKRMI